MKTRSNAIEAAAHRALKARANAPDPPLPLPAVEIAALPMDGVADAMNCSVPTVYRLVEDGYLTTFRIGRRRYASPRAVRKCVERLEEIGAVLPAQSGGNNRNGPGRSPAITPQAEVA